MVESPNVITSFRKAQALLGNEATQRLAIDYEMHLVINCLRHREGFPGTERINFTLTQQIMQYGYASFSFEKTTKDAVYAGIGETLLFWLSWRPWWERESLLRARQNETYAQMEERAFTVIGITFQEAADALCVYAQHDALTRNAVIDVRGSYKDMRRGRSWDGKAALKHTEALEVRELEKRVVEEPGVGQQVFDLEFATDASERDNALARAYGAYADVKRRQHFYGRDWTAILRNLRAHMDVARCAASEYFNEPLEQFSGADTSGILGRLITN